MIHFILSSTLFQGYVYKVSDVFDLDIICDTIKQKLIQDLDKLQLSFLKEKALRLKLHYHDYTIIDVLSNPNKEYYICECDPN